jgi:arylsulfatase A-like enzyme
VYATHPARGALAGIRTLLGLAALGASTILLGLAWFLGWKGRADPPQGAARRPNVVLIVTDDQRWDTLALMPHLQELAQAGVTFLDAFVPTPQCCPSRGSIFKGVYAHRFSLGSGEAPALGFHESRGDVSTIATWLQAEGYVTMLAGKYMNGYDRLAPTVPPGWNVFRALTRQGYRQYAYVSDGAIVTGEGYSTDALADMVLDFIDANVGKEFFVVYAPFAPHASNRWEDRRTHPIPAPRHRGRLATVHAYRPPSFFEPDLSDKSPWLQGGTRVGEAFVHERWVAHLESLLAVDEAVGAIADRLQALGIDQDTLVIVTSDNGLVLGEHQYVQKLVPYEESIRVPLVVRYPRRVERPHFDTHLVLNIDIAPTIMDLIGARPPDRVDGRSLRALLANDPTSWRKDFLLEFERTVLVPAPYFGVRTRRWKYVFTPARFRVLQFEELYDLKTDPFELDNLLVTDPANAGHRARAARLRARMERLRQ